MNDFFLKIKEIYRKIMNIKTKVTGIAFSLGYTRCLVYIYVCVLEIFFISANFAKF